jgi:hypothetical protein
VKSVGLIFAACLCFNVLRGIYAGLASIYPRIFRATSEDRRLPAGILVLKYAARFSPARRRRSDSEARKWSAGALAGIV